MVPLIYTPRLLCEFLAGRQRIEADELAGLRRAVQERPLVYPLGAGQADLIAVAAGLKPMLRRTLSRADADAEIQRYAHVGLAAHVVEPPRGLVKHGAALLYLGREPGRLREAAQAEQDQDDRELGRLLGYPRCCVEAFIDVAHPRTNAAAVLANFAGRVAPAWLNCVDLRVFSYVGWVPCGPDCALSLRYAEAVRDRMRSPLVRVVARARGEGGFEEFVEQVDAALAAHRLHVFDAVQLSMRGEFADGEVSVSQAWATARDRHPGFASGDEDVEATARLLALVRPGVRVRVSGQVLMIDDEAVVRVQQPFVVGFAAVGDGCARVMVVSPGTRG